MHSRQLFRCENEIMAFPGKWMKIKIVTLSPLMQIQKQNANDSLSYM